MASRSHTRVARRTRRRSWRRRRRFARAARWLWGTARQAFRAFLAAPRSVQIVLGVGIIVMGWFAVNWVYQTVRKPTELFFPVSGRLAKSPPQTWRQYEPLFRKHSTAVITPELLAAIAQVEGAGDPLARTYWEWRPASNPFEVYRPASSAVGMYQITDGTFREAKRFCIHDHVVVEDGPWHEFKSCWFNSLYIRTVPSHAIELTAAWLDRNVAIATEQHRRTTASLRQKQNLATVIHLCGNGAGKAYARRGFRLTTDQRCGHHDVRAYLARVNVMKKRFAQLATAD